jgi:hypothetical protein
VWGYCLKGVGSGTKAGVLMSAPRWERIQTPLLWESGGDRGDVVAAAPISLLIAMCERAPKVAARFLRDDGIAGITDPMRRHELGREGAEQRLQRVAVRRRAAFIKDMPA